MGNCFSTKNFPMAVVAPNTFVLKPIYRCKCQGCEKKLKKVEKLLQEIHGVHSTSIADWQVTISGTVNSQQVIWVLKSEHKLFFEEIPSMRQENYFPPPEPVANYEPSAPPCPYGYPYRQLRTAHMGTPCAYGYPITDHPDNYEQ